jgi:hypothetical protein
MSAAASGAAAAAAAYKQMIDEEEEIMTKYSPDELEKWEFKILRSNFGSFGNLHTLQMVLEEEKQAGWELVEKFDNTRLRFKRRIEERSHDGARTIDPYRSTHGTGSTAIVFWVLGGLLFFVIFMAVLGSYISALE